MEAASHPLLLCPLRRLQQCWQHRLTLWTTTQPVVLQLLQLLRMQLLLWMLQLLRMLRMSLCTALPVVLVQRCSCEGTLALRVAAA